jgi:hypothetical protein
MMCESPEVAPSDKTFSIGRVLRVIIALLSTGRWFTGL